MGEIIAGFHAGYAKERPADSRSDAGVPTDLDQWKLYLQKIIYPDHKLMPQHRRWIRYTLKFAVGSLLQRCGPGRSSSWLPSSPITAIRTSWRTTWPSSCWTRRRDCRCRP